MKPTHQPYRLKSFYSGRKYQALLLTRAQADVQCRECMAVSEVHGYNAKQLMAKIRRHCEGRELRVPEDLNYECPPFYAIKSADTPEGESWEEFRRRRGDVRELTFLRAYFFYPVKRETLVGDFTPLLNSLCITHFIRKVTPTMTEADKAICRAQRAHLVDAHAVQIF